MNAVRGPQNLAQCPFHILREDPLSATASIEHCVKCVTGQNAVLQEQSEEFQQTAFLTVIEASATYDPDHPSGALYQVKSVFGSVAAPAGAPEIPAVR